MKKIAHKMVDYFAYRNPHLWHQVVDDIALIIEEKNKRDMAKTKEKVAKLIKQLNKK